MNAIVASLHERRAEISMIRAVGAIPKQMRRIVLLEGTLLGAIAGCIGIFGGILFSYIVLSSLELTVIIIPYNQVVILALASVMLGAGRLIASQLRKFKLSDTLKRVISIKDCYTPLIQRTKKTNKIMTIPMPKLNTRVLSIYVTS